MFGVPNRLFSHNGQVADVVVLHHCDFDLVVGFTGGLSGQEADDEGAPGSIWRPRQ
jgi:hypothetical protein